MMFAHLWAKLGSNINVKVAMIFHDYEYAIERT